MSIEKICPWCGNLFEPNHGNDNYCCIEHQEEAKKERQKRKRDPVKSFIPILMKNHEILDEIFTNGKHELSANEIEAYGLDISLCRHMQAPQEFEGKLMLDFGTYYLITEPNCLTFQINKHDTAATV